MKQKNGSDSYESNEERSNDSLPKRRKVLRIVIIVFAIVYLIAMVPVLMVSLSNPESKKFFDKETIKSSMRKTIENGGELNNVKHIYEKRENKEIFIDLLAGKKSYYYEEDYPLSDILNDLLVDYYEKPESSDSTYLLALKDIIAENERLNPFDNLEENQKYNFQNIQEKLDSSYNTIAPDVIKIADELNNKNQLVTRYLNKSESSFTISIIALAITVIIGLIQIFQNHRTSNRLDDLEYSENNNQHRTN